MTERNEKRILRISFLSGLAFAIAEFIFSIYSRSHFSLTDAVYDMSELVFIALLLFLTPLFHKPMSEKHPYGYFQVESIFVIIKGVMMLSVTFGISADVIGSALTGGNPVNNIQVALFQLSLGSASIVIFSIMKRFSKNTSSPTITTELLGWKLDIIYSLGMALAFLLSLTLERTPLAFLSPYFDPVVAVLVMVFMLPESIKVLWSAIRDIFLFSPDETLMEEIKALCQPILAEHRFIPVFFDITRTGRHLWIAIYFQIECGSLAVSDLSHAAADINAAAQERYQNCTCELILTPEESPYLGC